MTVGDKIRELLDWSGMSQGELACRTGVPQTTISSYVTGRVSIPVDTVYKIAEALDVSPWTVINCTPLPATALDLTDAEAELVSDMRYLTQHQREIVVQSVKLMRKQNGQ